MTRLQALGWALATAAGCLAGLWLERHERPPLS
jgi:predicted outer membrane lipoprotein